MTINIAAARKIIDAATPGPWFAYCGSPRSVRRQNDDGSYFFVMTTTRERDSEFVTAARTLLPAALDEIESLRQQVAERDATIAELRAALSGLCRVVTYIHGVNPLELRLQDTFNRSKAILAKTAPKERT